METSMIDGLTGRLLTGGRLSQEIAPFHLARA